MKKWNYLFLFIFVMLIVIPNVDALTIRETMDSNDSYSTIEEGSIIIGVTKFLPDSIVTASKSSVAGANDAMLHVLNNGSVDEYEMPGVYYYVDSNVGWFYLDNDNNAIAIDDKDKLDIYYVDNVEKVLEIEYLDNNIDLDSLPKGVTFKDNKLFINATKSSVEFKTNNQKLVSYVMDLTTSKFIEDIRFCYTVMDGIITDYDSKCGNEIVIPTTINNEVITGIGDNAFKGANLVSVVIPNVIKTIGNSAFDENKLESVIIKDKYDELDFSSYGDNVFGEFDNITYDNELTRILNNVDEDFVIKYYKDFDVNFFNEDESGYILPGYIKDNLINIFKNNGYDREYNYCYSDCKYEEKEIDEIRNLYGISLTLIETLKYQFTLVKYDNDRINKVSKVINVSFEESGIKEDNDIIVEAMNNLEMDKREYLIENVNATRMKYLSDLEDLYNINIVFVDNRGDGYEWGDGEFISQFYGGIGYYLKDGVLYQKDENFGIIGEYNSYYPNEYVEDYNNIEEYIDYILDLFTFKTGVKNYEIIKNEDGSLYNVGYNQYETAISYYIDLFDKDYLEDWSIVFYVFYDDKYDSNGYTLSECFSIKDGDITDYDGTCGVNVVIPASINGIDITGINDNVFSSMRLRSVILPNNLKKIGLGAFANNDINKIEIPYGVEKIGNRAFADNNLSNISIPDSVTSIGNNILSNNKFSDENSFIYARDKDGKIDYSSLVLYSNSNSDVDELIIPNGVKKIGPNSFPIMHIKKLVIPYGVGEIGDEAFYYVDIEELSIPKSVTKLGIKSFNNTHGSEENAGFVYARNEDGTIDKSILMAYIGQIEKEILTIPEGVVEIRENVFVFNNIRKLSLPTTLKKIGDSAFKKTRLREVVLPENLIEIGNASFSNNDLMEIKIPSSVKIIGDNAFTFNRYLRRLTLNEGLETIGKGAFASCSLDGTLNIPTTVKNIGDYAFFDNGLLEVYMLGKRTSNDFDKLGINVFVNDNVQIIYGLRMLELPEFPIIFDVSVEDGDIVTKYDVFQIIGINYTVSENTDDTYNYRLLFNGAFNLNDIDKLDKSYSLGYKLYDKNNNLVKSELLDLTNIDSYGRFRNHEVYIDNLSDDNLRLELFVE